MMMFFYSCVLNCNGYLEWTIKIQIISNGMGTKNKLFLKNPVLHSSYRYQSSVDLDNCSLLIVKQTNSSENYSVLYNLMSETFLKEN